MKCYTIQSGNEFLGDVPRPIRSTWSGYDIVTTGCDDEAKHYKQFSQAKAWLRNNLKRTIDNYTVYKEKYKIEHAKKGWSTNSYKNKYTSAKYVWNWLDNAQVVELDLECPNFDHKHKIVWDSWRQRNNSAGKGLCKIECLNTSRYYCKCCGLKLKNIPFYHFDEGNGYNICIPCLYIRMDAIKAAFEGMPEDFRTNIVNELILGSM